MIAASFTALPSWVTNSDDVAELLIEDQESGIVEMEIELDESENVSFPIFEVIDISNEDLKEITQTDYDEEGEISMCLEDFPYDINMHDDSFRIKKKLKHPPATWK
jgi:hypothetical protein